MAITFVGAGAQSVSTTSGGTLTAAWPTGYTAVANDVGVLILVGKHNNGTSLQAPATLTGWTQVGTQFVEVGTYDLQLTVWVRRLTAGLAAPAVTVPAAYSTTSGGLTAQVAVYRGVSTTTIEDATRVLSSQTGTATQDWTPTGITTASGGAWVLSIVGSADDNALGLLAGSEQEFTARMSGANYDTTTGGDVAVGLADEEVLAPGAVTNPTWRQTLVASDQWVGLTMALRPEPTNATPTPATIAATVTLPAPTVTANNPDATVTPATIATTVSMPSAAAASWVNPIEVVQGTSTSNTTAGTSYTFSLGADGIDGDKWYAFLAVDNAGSQGIEPMLFDDTDIIPSNANHIFFGSHITADPGTASSGISMLVIEGYNTGGTSLAADTIQLNFTASVTSKAVVVFRVRGASGLNVNLLESVGGESTTNGGPASSLQYFNPAPQATGGSYYAGQIVFAIVALESNATITGDSDTTLGSWSSIAQATANTGTSTTSTAIAVQWKRITGTSTSSQSWDISWGSSADHAFYLFTMSASTLPQPPRNVTATPLVGGSTTLSWDVPVDEGYHYRPIRYGFWSRPVGDPAPGTQLVDGGFQEITTTNTTYTWTGLTAPYLVNVTAITEGGTRYSDDVTIAEAATVVGTWGFDARIGG